MDPHTFAFAGENTHIGSKCSAALTAVASVFVLVLPGMVMCAGLNLAIVAHRELVLEPSL